MSIEITCQQCQKKYRVKPELAGKRVRCVQCGFAVSVPGEAQGAHGHPGDSGPFADDLANGGPPQIKRPTGPKPAPPPVPRQVVRQDPRFDPNSMSDFPAPPPASTPPHMPLPRNPQPAAKKPQSGPQKDHELNFADDDPLFMSKPKVANDNLDDTAAAPAITNPEDRPEPRLDQEPMIPRGRGSSSRGSTRGGSNLADTAAPPAEDPFNLEPADQPIFDTPPSDPMAKYRAEQAAGVQHKCTGCGAMMKVGAIICLNCGFNVTTGQRGATGPIDDMQEMPSESQMSRWFGRGGWNSEDRRDRRLAILGTIICLLPLAAWKWPATITVGKYVSLAGLGIAILGAGLFAKRMRFTRAAVAAVVSLLAFAGYLTFRPIETGDSLAQNDATQTGGANSQPRPSDGGTPRSKPKPSDPATSEIMAIMKGPAEGIDPVNWHMTYLVHPDARVRFKSANHLIENTPAGRKQEVSRAFESRLADEHPQMRRLGLKGIELYIDDRTAGVVAPLLKDPEEVVREDTYKLLTRIKDPKAIPFIVDRLAEDPTLAREALATFTTAHGTSITRAFENSLRSDNPRQREIAAKELAAYPGPNTPGALLALLDDRDAAVRSAALITLGKLKEPTTLDAIIDRLNYDRTAAITALEQFGPGAEKAMLSMLKTGNAEMRLAAAEVLKTAGTKESMPALYDAALDNDFRLAGAAKEAMRKIDPEEFTPSMESVVDMESGHNTRMRAALERLFQTKVDKHQDRVAKMLVKMTMDNDPVVREGALKVLPVWGTKDTVTTFIDFLGDRSDQLRRQFAHAALGALKDPRGAAAVARWAGTDIPFAMNALHEMGPVAEDEVIELLNHQRSDIRIAAVRILKSWGSRQKALPALQAAIMRDRATIEVDAKEAMNAIRERPIVPLRRPSPSTQPVPSAS